MEQFSFFDTNTNEILNEDGKVLLYENFCPEMNIEELITNIIWQQDHIQMFGKIHPLPRLTAFFGDHNIFYEYSGIKMQAHPWPQSILNLKNKIEHFTNENFNCVLLNYYRNGLDHMSYHADDEKELGVNPTIASISFGATRKFTLKHRFKKIKIEINLHDKSLLIMKDELQHYWVHKINKSTTEKNPRINLTFRYIKKPF